ncbi:hypothetical protein [Halospeciosus flavus]|uniref:Uncharacterized protein n=1 Tax=Halospeciosus flavus TaxID=3032283 RepID=A0ABD5Z8X5_9EURY|nr:hypothetical protein [Halospeciosus flavus]
MTQEPMVAELHRGRVSIECHEVSEADNGVYLADSDGETIAYVPLDILEYVHTPQHTDGDMQSQTTSPESSRKTK